VRLRVRQKFTDAEFNSLYADPFSNGNLQMNRASQAAQERAWIDTHPETQTFQSTIVGFGKGFGRVASIADLSCGSGEIARRLARWSGIEPLLGEYVGGYEYVGPIEETIHEIPHVELFICTETIEHLDSPDRDLKLIREKTDKLLLSTPMDEGVNNGKTPATGHYWTWGRGDVETILYEAGFRPLAFIQLDMTPGLWDHCQFGVWQFH